MRAPITRHLWLAALLTGCSETSVAVTLKDLDGGQHTPQNIAAGQVHVVVFTSQECPIANAYAPTLGKLASEWAMQPVRLFLVHVDPELSIVAARQHRDDYKLPGTILMDPTHLLATALGATRTPEALVLDANGVVYRGRIDDQWPDLGVRAPTASMHDLRDAVTATLRGEKVAMPQQPAVGCLLPEPTR